MPRQFTTKNPVPFKYKLALLLFLVSALNLFMANLSLAQGTMETQETSQVSQQLNPGNFGISRIPDGFNFSSIHISTPGNVSSFYITSPETNNNYLELYDGRFDGGMKVSVQITDHVSGANTIPLTQESVIVSNFSGSQEVKGGTPELGTANILYYSATTPTETTDFQSFPESGALVLLDAPTDPVSGGRVGLYRFYPSYKLIIPDTTPAGTYTSTITYTVEDSVS